MCVSQFHNSQVVEEVSSFFKVEWICGSQPKSHKYYFKTRKMSGEIPLMNGEGEIRKNNAINEAQDLHKRTAKYNNGPQNGTKKSIQDEADEIFDSILYEAINIPGDNGIKHKDLNTDILTSQVVKEGQNFFHRNYFACSWAITLTEFVQFPVRRITAFVIRNASYSGEQFAYFRGVLTFMHIFTWFTGDITNKVAESSQDVLKVRKLHQAALAKLKNAPPPVPNKPVNSNLHILDALRKDMAHIEDPPYLPLIMTDQPSTPMSQFDMVLVHGIFFFLLDTNPLSVGLHNTKGYESYIQYLGIVGKYLGIQDRFNLALLPNPEVRKLVSQRIWVEILTPCFKNFHTTEFANLNYFAENGFVLNPFEFVMYLLIKDILRVGLAVHTHAYVNYAYRFFYGLIPLIRYLVKFPIILFFSNMMLKAWLGIGILYAKGKGVKQISDTDLYNVNGKKFGSNANGEPLRAGRTSRCMM